MPIPISHPCGTRAAAERHRRRKEQLCDECRAAERTYYRDRARLAYSIEAYRLRENARTAARLKIRRKQDPTYRQRVNKQRAERRQRELQLSLLIVDAVVIERLMNGKPVPATRQEKRATFNAMRDRGCSITECCTQLHISGSTGNAWESTRLTQDTSTGHAQKGSSPNGFVPHTAATDEHEVA